MRLTGLALAALWATAQARPTMPISDEASLAARAEAETPKLPGKGEHAGARPKSKEPVKKKAPAKKPAKKYTKKRPVKKALAIGATSGLITSSKLVSLSSTTGGGEQQLTGPPPQYGQQPVQPVQPAPPTPLPRAVEGCNGGGPCERPGDVCMVQLDDKVPWEACYPEEECCNWSASYVGIALPMFGCYRGTTPLCWPQLLPEVEPVVFKKYKIESK